MLCMWLSSCVILRTQLKLNWIIKAENPKLVDIVNQLLNN